jgi:Flp pilus assembly protein TadD
MPILPSNLVSATIVLLLSTAAAAQHKVINLTSAQQSQIRSAMKYVPEHHGQHTYNVTTSNNSSTHLLPIPPEMKTPEEFRNNLAVLQTALQSLSKQYKQYSGCRLLGYDVDGTVTDAAILHLYLNHAYPALLLAVSAAKTASKSHIDPTRQINNLGAILIETGNPEVAILYVEYAERLSPENPSIENNLGQAYAHVGLYGEATGHLNKALQKMPNHPLANLTLAYINQSTATTANKAAKTNAKDKVNQLAKAKTATSGALTNAKNALKGGFLEHAWQLVQQLDPDARLVDLLGDKVETVKFLKDEDPPIPPNCTSVHTGYLAQAQQQKFDQAVDGMKKYYDSIYQADDAELAPPKPKKGQVEQYKAIAEKVKTGQEVDPATLRSMAAGAESLVNTNLGFYDLAFTWIAFYLETALTADWGKDMLKREDISLIWMQQVRAEKLSNLSTYFNKKNTPKDFPDEQERCRIQDYFTDVTLQEYDKQLQTWRAARFKWERDYFNRQLFWLFIETEDAKQFGAKLSGLMSRYWEEMKTMASLNLYLFPCHPTEEEKNAKAPDVHLDTLKKDDFSCPYSDLTATTGTSSTKITLNCHKANVIEADKSALNSACTPAGKQVVYSGTLLLGLDEGLRNYLLIEDGIFADNSIKWARTMQWGDATGDWWLNSGISYMK